MTDIKDGIEFEVLAEDMRQLFIQMFGPSSEEVISQSFADIEPFEYKGSTEIHTKYPFELTLLIRERFDSADYLEKRAEVDDDCWLEFVRVIFSLGMQWEHYHGHSNTDRQILDFCRGKVKELNEKIARLESGEQE